MGKRVRQLQVAMGWIHGLLLMECAYVLWAEIVQAGAGERRRLMLTGLWLALPIAASFFLVKKVRNLWLFLLSGIALSAALWRVSGSVLTGALSLLVFLTRSYARIRKGRIRRMLLEMPGEAVLQVAERDVPTFLDRPRLLHGLVFGALYAATLVMNWDAFLRPVFWLFAADLPVCLCSGYFGQLEQFVETHGKLANFPIRTLRRVADGIFLLLLTGLVLCALPSLLYGEEPLADLEWKQERQAPAELPQMEQQEPGMNMADLLGELGEGGERFEPPRWLIVAFEVLMWGIAAAFVLFLVCVLLRALRNMAGSFAQEAEDEIFSLEGEAKEQSFAVRRVRGAWERWRSPSMQVRRRYKRAIRQSAGLSISGTETPAELEEKAELASRMSGEELGRLHGLYEKARYSEEGCTREDLA